MGAFKDLVDLNDSLGSFQALLDDVRRVLELTESNEVTGNKVQNLIVSNIIFELEDILD